MPDKYEEFSQDFAEAFNTSASKPAGDTKKMPFNKQLALKKKKITKNKPPVDTANPKG